MGEPFQCYAVAVVDELLHRGPEIKDGRHSRSFLSFRTIPGPRSSTLGMHAQTQW